MKKLLICFLLCFCILETTPIYVNAKAQTTSMTKRKKNKKVVVGYYYKWKTKKVTVTKREYLGEFWITHYCPCAKCCGVGGGRVTASGTTPTAGRTVGVNTNLIPYGTELQIGNTKGYVAEDTGGGIGWKHLDVFCSNHQEALAAGVGYEKVWKIYKVTKKKRYRAKILIYARRINVSTTSIKEELDRLYKYDINKYLSEVNYWKSKRYKIYRNDSGEHKVVEPIKYCKEGVPVDIDEAFGGIFGQIFRGGI